MTVKLSKLVDVRKIVPMNIKPREALDKPLILKSFELAENDYGEFVIMSCVGKETGELLLVNSYDKSIVDIVKSLPNPLPEEIAFSFHKEGRTLIMVD